jgi:hypothetical protein
MDDGFVANEGTTPKINIFGREAYGGVYDIYVYGSDEGSFVLDYNGVQTPKTVTGGVDPGEFVEGGNYVVFPNVDVNNTDSSKLFITYSNVINGFQFVRKKDPCEVGNGTTVLAVDYDVAGERNTEGGDTIYYGPEVGGAGVGYVQPQEFMIYDINVNSANAGQYQVVLDVNTGDSGSGTPAYPCPGLNLYFDDKFLGDVNRIVPAGLGPTDSVKVNLFAGRHTIEWQFTLGDYGFNVYDVNFTRIGDVNMVDCNDVIFYGFLLPGDYSKDCKVGYGDIDNNWRDLGPMLDNWMNCNNPDANDCF